MIGLDRQRKGWSIASLLFGLGLLVLLGLGGCGDRALTVSRVGGDAPASLTRAIAEAAPPEIFQELRRDLDRYQPQVTLLSPRPGEVIPDDRVTVKFRVNDLPLYKEATLGLGPHVHLFLDDQPSQSVYDANQTLVFQGLSPGTHTIRAIAVRPWDEAFKNEGAFAQVTFHSYTKTPKNNPDPAKPLLTYNDPQGRYGAEPIMLDFFLTNVPLHLIAQERSDDDIKDWRIRCTVNGESFIFDEWQPIYLKGLKPGKNWVQLELLDEDGLPFDNAFNNTVRLITYEPGGADPLAQLVRGELAIAHVRGIVDPTYVPPAPEPEPEPELELELEREPDLEIDPSPSPESAGMDSEELSPAQPFGVEALPPTENPITDAKTAEETPEEPPAEEEILPDLGNLEPSLVQPIEPIEPSEADAAVATPSDFNPEAVEPGSLPEILDAAAPMQTPAELEEAAGEGDRPPAQSNAPAAFENDLQPSLG